MIRASILALGLFFLGAGPELQSLPVFQDSEGIVAIDLESAPPKDAWRSETAYDGFSGASYYTWRGADVPFGERGTSGVLAFRFRLASPARYHVRFHNRHAHPARLTQDYMSWFIRLDGGEWRKTFSGPPRNQWKWDTGFDVAGHPPAAVDLAAGVHTLEVAPLHEGVSLDRVHLYRDGVAAPTQKARPPSPALWEGLAGPGPYVRLAPLAAKVLQGQQLGTVLKSARSRLESADAQEAREARMLVDALAGVAQRSLEEAIARKADDPCEAVRLLDRLGARFGGDETGAQALEESRRLQRDPQVQNELKAGALWRRIEELLGAMEPQDGSIDPGREEFRKKNQAAIESLMSKCRLVAKSYPDTAAGARSRALLSQYR